MIKLRGNNNFCLLLLFFIIYLPFFLCPDGVQDGSLSRDLQPFSGGKPKEQQSGKYLHNNNIEQHSYTLIEMSFKSDVKADSQTVCKRSQQAS